MRGEFMRASKMLMQGETFSKVCEYFAPTEVRPSQGPDAAKAS